jgi:large exoprotein involved in heme utilization and adhesion
MLMTTLMKRWFRTTALTVGFLVFLLGGFPTILYSLPLEGQITSGDGNFHQPNSNELIIQQNSDRLISQWRQFNIGTNEKVQFLQPNSDAIALNRITGGNPSEILGQLLAKVKYFY